MKEAAARVCFRISYSCALQTESNAGRGLVCPHLRGMAQACSPCPGTSPISGLQAAFQFYWEAAAFAYKGKGGSWAQRAVACQPWDGLWTCLCAPLLQSVAGLRYSSQSRTEQTWVTLAGCLRGIRAFPRAFLSVSWVQWVQPWSLLSVLIQDQFTFRKAFLRSASRGIIFFWA